MQIIADERYIARRKRIGSFGILAGFAVLGIAAIVSCTFPLPIPVMQTILVGCAGLGMLLFFAGSYYGDRFSGPLAHYDVIRKALKGLDKRYALLQYELPAPNVLLGPDGLTAVVVRSQGGEVTYSDGKWRHRQRSKFWRELGGQERVGQPHIEVEYRIDRIRRYLEKNLTDLEVPVRGIVVFVHPDIELVLEEEPPVPTLKVRELKAWLRGPGTGKLLPAEKQKQIMDELLAPFHTDLQEDSNKETG
jgi:hypothetical protein